MTISRRAYAEISLLALTAAWAMPAAAQTTPMMRRPIMPMRPVLQVGTPDLTVENIREEGGAILADVRNVGNGVSAATSVALYARGAPAQEQDFAALAGGAVRTVRFERPAGAAAVQVMIDPGNRVAEANEGNNRPAIFALAAAPTGDAASTAAGRPPIRLGRDPGTGRPPIAIGGRDPGATRDPGAGRDPATGRPPVVIGGRDPGSGRGPVSVPPIVADADDGPADEIIPPGGLKVVGRPAAVTLRTGGYRPMLQSLAPLKPALQVDSLRANPMQMVGKTTLNFAPVFNNPKALVNIAQKLRGMPQLAQVRVDRMEAVEVPQGLVVRSFLNYSLKPGACRDEVRRAQVASTGLRCAVRMSPAARAAAFADKNDARYVEPGLRAQKLAEANTIAAQQDAEIAAAVTTFRAQLNDPAQFATIAAQIGAADAQQLKAMDDTALAGELVNSGETKIEQVAFIAKQDASETAPPKKKSNPPPPLELPKPIDQTWDLGTYTYLAGFTLGRENEWRQRVQTSIKWCLVGCKKTYYAEVYAGFNYGFGLRFPIRLTGSYRYQSNNGAESPLLSANLNMFNGAPDDYAAAGLSGSQIFDGKEIVAQVGATAGFSAKLPFVGTAGVDFAVGKDFTEALPAPFTNGQFQPPEPGVPINIEYPFTDFDLIGGRANFGAFGAKVFPAVRVTLSSTDLRMTVHNNVDNSDIPLVYKSGPLNLKVDPTTRAADFRIGDPKYTLTFGVEPGIVARLFIDLGVWGHNWDWPVWFPDMKIILPPGGLQFSCHENTVCNRSFRFEPSGAQPLFYDKLQIWAYNFENEYLPQCVDETCSFGVRFVRLGTVLYGKSLFAKNPNVTEAGMASAYNDGRIQAKAIILDAQARKAESTSNAWGQLALAIWTKQCKDKQCFDEVGAIAKGMGPRAAALRKQYPQESDLKIQGMVNKEAGPKFSAAVKASEMRVATNALMKGMDANPLPKQSLPKGVQPTFPKK